jgi:hypothetical protein
MIRFDRPSGMPPRACLVALVGMLAGCAAAPVAHEEDGHELPRHHPRTFRRAVDAIEERSAALSSASGAARSELADIVRWLPMLAADTELGRADWDRVRGMSLLLASEFDASVGRPGVAPRWREAVTGLRAIADSLPTEPAAAAEEAR